MEEKKRKKEKEKEKSRPDDDDDDGDDDGPSFSQPPNHKNSPVSSREGTN